MKLGVCLKWVPSTTAQIRVKQDGSGLELGGLEHILSPYDEFALEAALSIADQVSGSTIVALTVGNEESAAALTHAFSLGIAEGIRVDAQTDAAGAARCAAAVFKPLALDLIFCGRQAIDDDQWVFPGTLAELLSVPHLTAVSKLTLAADHAAASCECIVEGGTQLAEIRLPAVISCNKGLNEPRSPTLKGRLNAKKLKPIVKSLGDLGLSSSALQPALPIETYLPPAEKSAGRITQAAPEQAARELVEWLRSEARAL